MKLPKTGDHLTWTLHARSKAYQRSLPIRDKVTDDMFILNVEEKKNFDDRCTVKAYHNGEGYFLVLAEKEVSFTVITITRDENLKQKKFRNMIARAKGGIEDR
jgi:hypothetical protein